MLAWISVDSVCSKFFSEEHMGLGARKSIFANNKGADQPLHLRRLVSGFDIRLLESIISKLLHEHILNSLAILCSSADCKGLDKQIFFSVKL